MIAALLRLGLRVGMAFAVVREGPHAQATRSRVATPSSAFILPMRTTLILRGGGNAETKRRRDRKPREQCRRVLVLQPAARDYNMR